MKKLILLGSVFIASNLLANNPIDKIIEKTETKIENMFQFSHNDDTPPDVCSLNAENCFNAGKHHNAQIRIQTKVAGTNGGFQLRLRHRKGCGWDWHNHHIAVALVDNLTGKLITEPKAIDTKATFIDDTLSDDEYIDTTFNVANAYKNVKVKFFHLKPTECNHHQFRWMHQFRETIQNQTCNLDEFLDQPFIISNTIQCYEVNSSNVTNMTNFPYWGERLPECNEDIIEETISQNLDEIKSAIEEKRAMNTWRFRYAIPTNDECYVIEPECADEAYISQSSDSFAIRPSYIQATLPSSISANIPAKIEVVVKNASGDTITNYNNSSANLKVSFKDSAGNDIAAQYSFKIKDGIGSGTVIFSEPVNNVTVEIIDEHFADVDKDDTDKADRVTSIIPGTSSTSTVTNGGSKYWAGAGTNEEENNPRKNTIDADIKQNTTKDLHYHKINW